MFGDGKQGKFLSRLTTPKVLSSCRYSPDAQRKVLLAKETLLRATEVDPKTANPSSPAVFSQKEVLEISRVSL